ncbi:hypothetical protein Ade02nite_01060 [Paractinoplanes deccanensis]|uniref:Major facilitator superfamily (MFS) profile domain-containing protein n=1 Tax=Paractinoplanes deccanensis TaxID=113561 RepID=A0ABQ3XUS7_9ACTN|nr:MFS transporter [Actinoplanes deccanensis]GID71465.1 hypothetical protein Ade02nite_01060 [Actinoplanes deccanensis]
MGRLLHTGDARLGTDYWRLWWANVINSVGDGVFIAALPLLAVTVTVDPQEIAAISAAAYLPWLLLSLPAGAIVDRHDRATLMWRCQVFQAVVAAGITLAALTHHTTVPLLLIAGFLLQAAQVVITNAAQSVLPHYVPARLLPRANGNQYIAQSLGTSTIGPPLGGVLFAALAALPFGVDAASFVMSAALLAMMPAASSDDRPARRPMRVEIAEGLSWLRRYRLLRTLALMLGMNTFCFQMAFATLVLLATQTLHLTERAYGLMLVGYGIGGIIGGLVNNRIARRAGPLPALAASYAGNAAVYVAIGLAPNGLAMAALMAASGFLVTITGVVTVSLRQQIVPVHLLGRVNSVYRMLGWGLMPLGSLAGGVVAQHLGLRAPFVSAGFIRLAVLALTFPAIVSGIRSLRTP